MDFSKVQKIRDSDRKKRLLARSATVLFILVMGFTFAPKLKTFQTQKATVVSADSFVLFLKEEKLREAYELGLKPSLKKEHPFPLFERNFQTLLTRKGGVISYKVADFVSRPNGKPYELLTYQLLHDRGLSKIDLALEPDGPRYIIRAYRVTATGM